MHSKDIIHRDLSLGNILIAEIEYNTAESAITPARVVVNDFDVVREEGDFKEKTYVGKDGYRAPEIKIGIRHRCRHLVIRYHVMRTHDSQKLGQISS